MEKVVKLLDNIDTKAEAILNHVSKTKIEIHTEYEEKIKNLKHECFLDTQKHLNQLQIQADNQSNMQISKLQKEQDNYLELLEQYYLSTKEEYISIIISRIISFPK